MLFIIEMIVMYGTLFCNSVFTDFLLSNRGCALRSSDYSGQFPVDLETDMRIQKPKKEHKTFPHFKPENRGLW